MRLPLTLSLHVPDFDFPGVEPDALFDKLVELAHTAERSGWSGMTVMDHLHQIATVGPPTNRMLEGNVALAGLAARTERLNLGLLVGGVTYRNPALLAKLTTTLDVVSRGRAFLGLGAAWFEQEHLAYGFEFPPLRERFVHLEDALQIARLMFTQPESTFEGRRHAVRGALNVPQPLRGDIPILVGGSGERKTLRLVARFADGCNLFGDAERVRHLLGVLRRHCEDVGRDEREITKTRMATIVIEERHEDALARLPQLGLDPARAAGATVGGPEHVAQEVQGWIDAGIEGVTVMLPEAHRPEIVELVGRTLGPLLGSPR
jgi:F420-dependent oxidoreductase-like protein